MSVVRVIDTVTEWARVHICDCVELKQPPEELDAPEDGGYNYKLVRPAAFPLYVPTSERMPPDAHGPVPSLCVRFLNGQDEPTKNSGFVDLQFCFSTWDPGIHGKDILKPNGDGSFRRWSGEEADAYFKRSSDGWRDAWNFVDTALRAVESVTEIGGYSIDRTVPVKYGPLTETEREILSDFYPMWFAWVTFRVTYPLRRNIQDLNKFL